MSPPARPDTSLYSHQHTSLPVALKCVCVCCSYLFPDGRAQNPDLTGLCEPSPQDHIKVTQVGLLSSSSGT